MAGSGRKKTGGKPPRGTLVPARNVQAAPAPEDAGADDMSMSEITDVEDATDEEAPADNGSLWQVRLAIRALGNSYTTQGQCSAGALLLG